MEDKFYAHLNNIELTYLEHFSQSENKGYNFDEESSDSFLDSGETEEYFDKFNEATLNARSCFEDCDYKNTMNELNRISAILNRNNISSMLKEIIGPELVSAKDITRKLRKSK